MSTASFLEKKVDLRTAKTPGGAVRSSAIAAVYPIPLRMMVTKKMMAYAGTVLAKNIRPLNKFK